MVRVLSLKLIFLPSLLSSSFAQITFFCRPSTLPWLYYSDAAATEKSTQIQFKVAFHVPKTSVTSIDTFTFWLAVYAVNGTFLGFEKLQNQLQVHIKMRKGRRERTVVICFSLLIFFCCLIGYNSFATTFPLVHQHSWNLVLNIPTIVTWI